MGDPLGLQHFLVVDDEALIGAALARVLHPHHVERCTSAEDAIRVLGHNQHFDAIVTDLMLPGLSGLDLLTWLATHRPDLSERVAFMTGSPHSALARSALILKAYPLMLKPFNMREIRTVLEDLTGRKLGF